LLQRVEIATLLLGFIIRISFFIFLMSFPYLNILLHQILFNSIAYLL